MKATSRLRRSSFATTIGHLSLRALSRAARSCRPQIEGVSAFARFDLDVLASELQLLGLSEPPNCLALSL
jgi:hypothetical protein